MLPLCSSGAQSAPGIVARSQTFAGDRADPPVAVRIRSLPGHALRAAAGQRVSSSRLGQRLDVAGQVPAGISGIDHAAWLNEEDRGLDVGARAVLGPARNDEKLARTERDHAAPQLDRQPPVDDQEEFVGIGMPVPGEVAKHLHDLYVVVVELGDLLWRPVLADPREHRLEVHSVHVLMVAASRPGPGTAVGGAARGPCRAGTVPRATAGGTNRWRRRWHWA